MKNSVHMDKIKIEDLTVSCIIGIAEKERIIKQDVTINITMFTDITRASRTDDIADTINYKIIKNRVRDFIQQSQFFLIEKMAASIVRLCFEDSKVKAVIVKVEKPGALTLARSVSVEIHRTREDYEL